MSEVIRLLMSFVRLMIVGNTSVRLVTLAVVCGVVGLIVINERKRHHALSQGAYQGVTLLDETETLRIYPRGATLPKNIRTRLRAFDNADDLYTYVYEKFDDALFRTLILHRGTDAPPVLFAPEVDQSPEANRERLREMLGE